jgi:hypothetical protein
MPSLLSRSRSTKRWSLAFALSLVAVGCYQAASVPVVGIRVTPDTITMNRNSAGVRLEINSVISNRGPEDIYLFPCNPELQRQVDGRWLKVWESACVPESQERFLKAGDSSVVPVTVLAYTSETAGPLLDPRLTTGTYRLLWSVGYRTNETGPTKALAQSLISSPPFTIKDAPSIAR